MSLTFVDRYYDSCFGYINLTNIEKKIVNTPVFQRLHQVRQQALIHIVFPNGVHTRFSHSLGVLHVMHKMIESINNRSMVDGSTEVIDPTEWQTLRLAALLHDIGHLPFSHSGESATEQLLKDTLRQQLAVALGADAAAPQPPDDSGLIFPNCITGAYKLHECLSGLIVNRWNEIKDVVQDGFNPEEIVRIINGKSIDSYKTTLLHSELDADRLDYLIRDSKNLGVSYGNIEIDHIVSLLRPIFHQGVLTIGVDEKNLHSVEHYILARYFMYCQVINHPKIYYLEKMLKQIYRHMIQCADQRFHVYSGEELVEIILQNEKHSFYEFNDTYLLTRMRMLHDEYDSLTRQNRITPEQVVVNENIKMIFSGNIPRPKLMFKCFREDNQRADDAKKRVLEKYCQDICTTYDLPAESIVCGYEKVSPTKYKNSYGLQEPTGDDFFSEAIKIIYTKTGQVRTFAEDQRTIFNKLSGHSLKIAYVFVNDQALIKLDKDIAAITSNIESFEHDTL